MSYPNIMFGPEGEQFSSYTSKPAAPFPIGCKMHHVDGRAFRFVLNGATALVAGNMQQGRAPKGDHVGLSVQAAAAVGAKSVAVTLGATATTADEYAEGYLFIEATPGQSYVYRIKTHAAASASATQTLTLDPRYPVQVALTTGSKASLVVNKYDRIVVAVVTTLTQVPVGAAILPLAASAYGWVATGGPAGVTTAGTLVIPDQAVSPTGTAGAVGPQSATLTLKETPVGRTMRVGGTGNASLIDLALDK